MKDWKQALQEALPEAVAWRRALHRVPELAFREVNTTAFIRRTLEDCGIEVLPQIMETGVVAVIRGALPGKTVMLREDIDALPMGEETGLAFASETPGVCHSCGHDIHTSSLLLAGKVLQQCREILPGAVVLVFQPAEETASGAKAMLQAGLKDLYPDTAAVIGFHVAPQYPAGTVGLIKGPACASTDEVRVILRGEGGHGAHPYRCADTVAAAGYLLAELQTLISRENPAVKPAVLTFGMIHGGSAPNAIPKEVELRGTLRAFHEDSRQNLWAGIRRVARCCAEIHRATAEVTILEGVPVLCNDPAMTEGLAKAARDLYGPDSVIWEELPSPGSDDFSCFSAIAPGVQFRVGSGNDDPRSKLGLHCPETLFDEKAIEVGAAVMIGYLMQAVGGAR